MAENDMFGVYRRPDFSVVTVCLNSEGTIRDTVESVRNQQGVIIEHIIKDGGSEDDTLSIAREANPEARVLVKRDRGVYDAMNQGFEVARGKIIAFLNSDDFYTHNQVLANVLDRYGDTSCDIVFGDIFMIDDAGKTRRRWCGRELKPGTLGGMQLPHPAVFVRRDILEQLDIPLDPSYKIAADLKQQLLLIEKKNCLALYLPEELTCMRIGGESTVNLRAVLRGWVESARAYREVHGASGVGFVFKKVARKLRQFKYSRHRKT